ncbi:MAG: hypothetical protein KDH09_12940 [Chrysiogenetes bacterium]|nr:hypothetical protein [Chrysiogenetes bacterium]
MSRRSRKRSATKRARETPPERVVFFTDRDVGRYIIPEALRNLGESVTTIFDAFPSNHEKIPDEQWLELVGRNRWVAITCDQNIRRRYNERKAVIDFEVREFVFTSGNLSGPQMAEILALALPAIHRFLGRHEGPFIASISKKGIVKRLQ